MITRILDWYFSTDNPNVAAVREFVRQHRVLRAAARALFLYSVGFLRLVVGYLRLAVRFLRLAVVHPRAVLR